MRFHGKTSYRFVNGRNGILIIGRCGLHSSTFWKSVSFDMSSKDPVQILQTFTYLDSTVMVFPSMALCRPQGHQKYSFLNCVKIIVARQSHAFQYSHVIMSEMASQITSLTIVYPTVYSGVDQRKHKSSVSLAFVWGIHRDRWIPRTRGQ